MESRVFQFTQAEDSRIWRVAIEVREKKKLGAVIKEKLGSKRTVASLFNRFKDVLVPRLRYTNFHPETKLNLCKAYQIRVDDDFLKELRKDTSVQITRCGFVTSFTLKQTCKKNEDMELSDEEFMKITAPLVPKRREFSAEEDAEIWKYVLERHHTSRSTGTFWEELAEKLNRSNGSVNIRFSKYLAPKLHTMDIPMEDKLKVYVWCKKAVDEGYLKELENYAVLQVNTKGCITSYKLKDGRPEKRKIAEKTVEAPKKTRKSRAKKAVEHQEDPEEEEDDLIIDGVVPGTGHPQPERILIVPKLETVDVRNQSDDVIVYQERVVPAYFSQPKTEVVDPVYFQRNGTNGDEQNQCASIGMMKQTMQRVEESIEKQGTATSTSISEIKEELKGLITNQSEELKKHLETYLAAKVSEMQNNIVTLMEAKMVEMMQGNIRNESAPPQIIGNRRDPGSVGTSRLMDGLL